MQPYHFVPASFFPHKQDVSFNSVNETGEVSLFYCFGPQETWRWREQLIPDFDF